VTEQELLLDTIRRLNRASVEYMLTGSMASNYWGIPRTTHDLDFVVQLHVEAVSRLVEEFREGFYIDEASVRAAFQAPHQFNAIDLRSALKVDFWMLRSVPFEQEMFRRRIRISLLGEPTWIASAEDVVLHKLYWHSITPSDRQLGDAAGVVAVQGSKIDLGHLRRWAPELKVAETLEELLAARIRPKRT
jgi:hypothetical protein